MVAFLARPGETQILEAAQQILTTMVGEASPERQRHRVEAARLLGELPGLLRSVCSRICWPIPTPWSRRKPSVPWQSCGSDGWCLSCWTDWCIMNCVRKLQKPWGIFGDLSSALLRDHLGDASVSIEARRETRALW